MLSGTTNTQLILTRTSTQLQLKSYLHSEKQSRDIFYQLKYVLFSSVLIEVWQKMYIHYGSKKRRTAEN